MDTHTNSHMPNQAPENPENMEQTPTPQGSGSKVGPIIGIIVIILVLLLGVLYFWGQRVDDRDTIYEAQEEAIEEDLGELEASMEEDFAELDAQLESSF